ncbi:HAD-IA family hydrolase [Actinopolyspora halophila]|uniref:HAD-IA family hydrolase n=1 Tax=Actinopolyspora halophila TaxID=1850 RepID=UPI0003A062EF|nr:HAD-IA family hydrolase [Actinopolyspora halophila]
MDLAVLDMAGTTVAENGVVEKSFRAALERVGATLPADLEQRFRELRGGSKPDMFRAVLDGDRELAARAHAAFEEALAEYVSAGTVTALPHATETIRRLRALDIRVALVTGFEATTRDLLIESLSWTGLADLVLCSSDVDRGRPHPDLVLTAALKLSASAMREVMVVGDTVNDLLAGTNSGAGLVAGVLSGAHGVAELGRAPHTHILPTIGELPAVLDGTA